MSIRLDPRRVNALQHLAGEAGVRPGDLVRQWVEERIDAARGGASPDAPFAGSESLVSRLEALTARVAALEAGQTGEPSGEASAVVEPPGDTGPGDIADAAGPMADPTPTRAAEAGVPPEPGSDTVELAPATDGETERPRGRNRVSAAPSGERVALHDEMIAVIRERGPMPAGELAAAIVERGRYSVPRSGKPLDAKTVSQRVSNPTYRSRFVRSEGRIGLADER